MSRNKELALIFRAAAEGRMQMYWGRPVKDPATGQYMHNVTPKDNHDFAVARGVHDTLMAISDVYQGLADRERQEIPGSAVHRGTQ